MVEPRESPYGLVATGARTESGNGKGKVDVYRAEDHDETDDHNNGASSLQRNDVPDHDEAATDHMANARRYAARRREQRHR